jgi:hypothetical protein
MTWKGQVGRNKNISVTIRDEGTGSYHLIPGSYISLLEVRFNLRGKN